MKIRLGNFIFWRIKKVILFLGCMCFSLFFTFFFREEQLSTMFMIGGLLIYGCVIQISFVKKNIYEAEFFDEEDEIKVKIRHTIYIIKKNEIKEVQLKEVRYGGKWLETVGYRLIVRANRKYIFDSVFLEDNSLEEKQQMLNLKKIFDQVKSTPAPKKIK